MEATLAGSFKTGRATIGTGQGVSLGDFKCKRGVKIKTASGNGGVVYVGNADTTADAADGTDGFPLAANQSEDFDVDNLNKLFITASASSQKIFFFAR